MKNLKIMLIEINININGNNGYQMMDGFGTSLSVLNDPHIIGGNTSAPIAAGLTIPFEYANFRNPNEHQ